MSKIRGLPGTRTLELPMLGCITWQVSANTNFGGVETMMGKNMLMQNDHNKTGLFVAGLGAAVSGLGAIMSRRNRLGAGILGFGLAHIALGLLDTVRD